MVCSRFNFLVVVSWVLLSCGRCLLAGEPVTGEPTSGAASADLRDFPQGWQNGWETGQKNWYHHASQGTMMIPLDWFMALEQPSIEPTAKPEMFSDPDYLSQFGFLRSVKDDKYNADNLPVGFAISQNWVDPNKKTPSRPFKALGLTCAACHTSEITYGGTRLRIEGGSAMIDLGAFQKALGLSLLITNSSSKKFEAFADRWFQRQGLPPAMEGTIIRVSSAATAVFTPCK